jgi:hypothetical protein
MEFQVCQYDCEEEIVFIDLNHFDTFVLKNTIGTNKQKNKKNLCLDFFCCRNSKKEGTTWPLPFSNSNNNKKLYLVTS